MPHFVPLSPSAHQGQAWLKSQEYHVFADQSAIALVAQELPPALAVMPVGFRRLKNDEFELVAICALTNQQNLFVHADGRWLAGYRPALLRAYPFLFQKDTQGQHILCVDDSSGMLVNAEGGDGDPFFDEDGQPGEKLGQLIKFLTRWEKQRSTTQKAVNMLASFGLLTPWNVNVETPEGESQPGLAGYYRIDEKALNNLDAKKLDALRQLGALTIAYAQLFSQHRLDVLTRLYKLHQQHAEHTQHEPDIELLFDSGDDSLSFDFDS